MPQKKLDRFGDYFHEVPEPEIFPLPSGGSVSSECVINSLGMTYTIEVIPRQAMIDILDDTIPSRTGGAGMRNIALGFRVVEHAGSNMASICLEQNGHHAPDSLLLADVNADSLPEAWQAA